MKRFCNSCDKSVIDITSFKSEEVENLLNIDADSCLCIRSESPHIEWIDDSDEMEGPHFQICTVDDNESYDGCRIVKTARTPKQIESNKESYFVIEKAVEINDQIKTKVVIKYDRIGYSGFDFRAMPPGLTNWWHPIKSTSPFAAYLVPKDVREGEKVFVPDIIEDFVASSWNQGDVYRFNEGFGVFTGDDIEFDYPTDPEDVVGIVG